MTCSRCRMIVPTFAALISGSSSSTSPSSSTVRKLASYPPSSTASISYKPRIRRHGGGGRGRGRLTSEVHPYSARHTVRSGEGRGVYSCHVSPYSRRMAVDPRIPIGGTEGGYVHDANGLQNNYRNVLVSIHNANRPDTPNRNAST